jgi:hypothetical protein
MSSCHLCDIANPSALIDFGKHTIDFFWDNQMEKLSKFMLGGRRPIFLSDIFNYRKIDICLLALNRVNEEMVINSHSNWDLLGRVFWSTFSSNHRLLPVWESDVTKSLVAL